MVAVRAAKAKVRQHRLKGRRLSDLRFRVLGPKGLCCPSYLTLQRATGLCRQSITNGLKRLEAAGILKITRRLVREVVGGIAHTRQGSNFYGFNLVGNSNQVSRVYVGTNHINRSFKCESDDTTRRPAVLHRFVSEAALDKVCEIASGWDRQALLAKFHAWPGSKKARDMDAAFLAWVRSFTKGMPPK
jgi:hypothetical protein